MGAMKEIAGKLGVSRPLVSQVVNDKAANTPLTRKVKVAVARKIGLPVDEVFPPAGAASPSRQMVEA